MIELVGSEVESLLRLSDKEPWAGLLLAALLEDGNPYVSPQLLARWVSRIPDSSDSLRDRFSIKDPYFLGMVFNTESADEAYLNAHGKILLQIFEKDVVRLKTAITEEVIRVAHESSYCNRLIHFFLERFGSLDSFANQPRELTQTEKQTYIRDQMTNSGFGDQIAPADPLSVGMRRRFEARADLITSPNPHKEHKPDINHLVRDLLVPMYQHVIDIYVSTDVDPFTREDQATPGNYIVRSSPAGDRIDVLLNGNIAAELPIIIDKRYDFRYLYVDGIPEMIVGVLPKTARRLPLSTIIEMDFLYSLLELLTNRFNGGSADILTYEDILDYAVANMKTIIDREQDDLTARISKYIFWRDRLGERNLEIDDSLYRWKPRKVGNMVSLSSALVQLGAEARAIFSLTPLKVAEQVLPMLVTYDEYLKSNIPEAILTGSGASLIQYSKAGLAICPSQFLQDPRFTNYAEWLQSYGKNLRSHATLRTYRPIPIINDICQIPIPQWAPVSELEVRGVGFNGEKVVLGTDDYVLEYLPDRGYYRVRLVNRNHSYTSLYYKIKLDRPNEQPKTHSRREPATIGITRENLILVTSGLRLAGATALAKELEDYGLKHQGQLSLQEIESILSKYLVYAFGDNSFTKEREGMFGFIPRIDPITGKLLVQCAHAAKLYVEVFNTLVTSMDGDADKAYDSRLIPNILPSTIPLGFCMFGGLHSDVRQESSDSFFQTDITPGTVVNRPGLRDRAMTMWKLLVEKLKGNNVSAHEVAYVSTLQQTTRERIMTIRESLLAMGGLGNEEVYLDEDKSWSLVLDCNDRFIRRDPLAAMLRITDFLAVIDLERLDDSKKRFIINSLNEIIKMGDIDDLKRTSSSSIYARQTSRRIGNQKFMDTPFESLSAWAKILASSI